MGDRGWYRIRGVDGRGRRVDHVRVFLLLNLVGQGTRSFGPAQLATLERTQPPLLSPSHKDWHYLKVYSAPHPSFPTATTVTMAQSDAEVPLRRSTRASSAKPTAKPAPAVAEKLAAKSRAKKRAASPEQSPSPPPKRTRTANGTRKAEPERPVARKASSRSNSKAGASRKPRPNNTLATVPEAPVQTKPYFNPLPPAPKHERPGLLLFAWGAGNFGQFGMGPDFLGEQDKPKRSVWAEQQIQTGTFGEIGAGLESIVAGGLHSLFIDEKGTVRGPVVIHFVQYH